MVFNGRTTLGKISISRCIDIFIYIILYSNVKRFNKKQKESHTRYYAQ